MQASVESAQGEQTRVAILQRQFNDVDQLIEQLQVLTPLQLTQLSTDPLQVDVAMAVLDEAIFCFTRGSCPLLAVGEKRKGFIAFNVVLETNGLCAISHKRRVSPDILFGLQSDLETNLIAPANLQLASVYTRRDVFQNYLQIMERSDLDEKLWAHNYIAAPVTLPTVRTYLNQMHHLILHQPNLLQQPRLKKLVIEDFFPLLVNAIPPMTGEISKPLPPLARSQMVKEAENYLMEHLDQPLTLRDLCEVLHVTRTPLFNGFREVFGVGPMEYLKAQRLHSVRRLLQATDPRTDSVTAIARRYGFWSAGHFTRDYKQMFGELPSETLKQV